MSINLFINWHTSENQKRNDEYLFCLKKNLQNKFIDKIFILTDDVIPIEDPKIILISFIGRPTFNNFFSLINRTVNSKLISIISNLDIYFDDSIRILSSMNLNRRAFCLTRYNIINEKHDHVFFRRADSQDVWILKGEIRNIEGDFQLGVRGCDNRIAFELRKAGYHVLNPSLTIKSFHYHLSGYRNESYNKIIIPPPYLKVRPCV